jgi:allophanate hydrolase subunit 1
LIDDTEVKPVLKLKTTDFLRENLKIEILYKERYSRQLIEFMKRVSGYRLENFIELLIHVDLKCTL